MNTRNCGTSPLTNRSVWPLQLPSLPSSPDPLLADRDLLFHFLSERARNQTSGSRFSFARSAPRSSKASNHASIRGTRASVALATWMQPPGRWATADRRAVAAGRSLAAPASQVGRALKIGSGVERNQDSDGVRDRGLTRSGRDSPRPTAQQRRMPGSATRRGHHARASLFQLRLGIGGEASCLLKLGAKIARANAFGAQFFFGRIKRVHDA